MPYVPFHADWQDTPSTATPITAAFLEYLEAALAAATLLGEGAVAKTLADAKGDLIVATGADTFARLAIGVNDTVPAAASGETSGILWKKIGNAMIASDAAIAISKLAGYPNDVTKALLGDGTWGSLSAPTGVVFPFAGAAAPSGYLMCDGAAVSRATYAALNTLLNTAGYPYGAGDGSTTFNVPDIQGRVIVGKGTHADVDTLGENDGAALANRRPKHKHTVNDPGHTHGVKIGTVGGGVGDAGGRNHDITYTSVSATTGITVGPQTTVPTDGPAYIVLNHIIKT